jgi:hypothetical protein
LIGVVPDEVAGVARFAPGLLVEAAIEHDVGAHSCSGQSRPLLDGQRIEGRAIGTGSAVQRAEDHDVKRDPIHAANVRHRRALLQAKFNCK